MSITAPDPAHPITLRSVDPLPPILCAVTLDTRGKACLRYACQRAANPGQPLSVVHIAHQTKRNAGIHQRETRSPRLLLPIIEIAHDLLNKFLDEFQQELASVDPEFASPEFASAATDRIVEPGIPGKLFFATDDNKKAAERFVNSVEARLSTDHLPALFTAVDMGADVIFF